VKRRFQSSFYAKFSRLEYSVRQDAASLQTAFAVVTWAKKVHRLQVLQDFLTGST